MITRLRSVLQAFATCLSLLAAAPPALAQVPVVSNLKAVQRDGTKLVDITYDLAADTATVSLQISGDGGVTFAVPAVSVTGAVGSGVSTGTGKALTWNAGADWNGQFSSQVRVKVVVDDGVAAAGLVAIPTGLFMMGDSLDGYASAPVHEVAVRAIYVAKTEVTKAQWDLVRGWAVGRGYTSLHAGAGKSRDHPIQSIEWYQCLLYCNARSEQEGLMPVYYTDESQTKVYRSGNLDLSNVQVKWNANGYRLPTEAEWEKAARGGLKGKRFPWGDTISHSQANYFSSSDWAYDVSPTRGYHPSTVAGGEPPTLPVGSFAANGYGLYDMAGNVFEWCWDRYGSYAGAAVDPPGPDIGANRVIRGSSCRLQANGCRNADRYQNGGGLRSDNLGFRVLRSSVPATTATTSDFSVDTRDPVAWTLFSAAEAGLAVGDVGLVSLSPLDKLSVVAGGEAHDGAAALKLMAADGAASYAERSIEGPALVSFWWRVSSEKDYDLFSYSVDGAVQESISGEGVWLKRSLSLAAGRHALRWTYRKDAADKNFQDAGFLDEVVIVDAYRNLEVRSGGAVVAGSAALDYGTVKQDDPEVAKAIVFKNTGTLVMPFTASLPADSGFVFANGQPTSTQSLPAGQEVSLSLVLQTSLAGPKTALMAIMAAGSRTEPPAITLSGFIQGPILQVAGSGLVRGSFVNSGTAAAWETATTSLPGGDSGAAIKTGSTPDNGHSTIGARFDGPGLLRWQWKVSAQKDYDWLVCEVNGVEVAGISTKAAAWQSQVIQVPAGAEARWIYRKDASNQSGTDSGYLAEVRFDKFTAAPVSFNEWSAAQGAIAPLDLTGPGKIQGMFAWLGGFDPAAGPGEDQYLPTVSGGFYRYRYAISKTAGGQVQPQASSDLATWNSRGLSQTLLSENEATATVELAVPAAGRTYTRLKAEVPDYYPGMVKVAGGALPADSWAGAQSVEVFYIGKYEVQWSEWQSVRTWARAHGYTIGVGAGRGAAYPVTDVNWYDVLKWCNARSAQEGLAPVYTVGGAPYRTGELVPDVSPSAKGYRLPSEKEWEFAARGGIATHGYTYSGSNDIDTVAWYDGNSGGGIHVVGTKAGNELGLFDMSGNAAEWCFDLYSSDSARVIPGGSYYAAAAYCRATFRNYYYPGNVHFSLGLRVARSAVP
jgi:formylglycine-generating enzyme required for sulfatase activity